MSARVRVGVSVSARVRVGVSVRARARVQHLPKALPVPETMRAD